MARTGRLGWTLMIGLAIVGWLCPQPAAAAAMPSADPFARLQEAQADDPSQQLNPASAPTPITVPTRPGDWTAPTRPEPAATLNGPPDTPVLNFPADGAIVPLAVELGVTVSDIDGDPLVVTFFGRSMERTVAPTLTLIALPDTQYYSCGTLCNSDPAVFRGQTQWISEQAERRQIRFVAHLGDIVEFGDTFSFEWDNADAAMSLLDPPRLPFYPDGIPYALAVGNHDQLFGTMRFNETFGINRFDGRVYYGGHYGIDNNNHFALFEAGSLEFIVISLEYAVSPDPAVLAWASELLGVHAHRRAIIVAHHLIDTGDPGAFGAQGEAIYDALRHRPNLFLMLSGHIAGEGRREDTPHHQVVHTLLADYQNRANGGNGWLRILELDPSANQLAVRTYSPWLDEYEVDADSHFTLTVDLQHPVFQPMAVYGEVTSGSSVTTTWSGLQPGQAYEWYVTVSDGADTTVGPVWRLSAADYPLHAYMPVVMAGSRPSQGKTLLPTGGRTKP